MRFQRSALLVEYHGKFEFQEEVEQNGDSTQSVVGSHSILEGFVQQVLMFL